MRKNLLFFRTMVLLLFVFFGWNISWGQTITLNTTKATLGGGTSYTTTETAATVGSYSYKLNNWIANASDIQARGNQATVTSNFYIFNTTAIPGNITSITITGTNLNYSKINLIVGTSAITSSSGGVAGTSATWTVTGSNNYFRIQFTNGATTGTGKISNITINYASPGFIAGGTTAAPFTTTYGTASAAQTFAVSGSGLSADLVATAPTGFEVSADGTTYGNTATFTQTSGSASGTLSIRLKANAAVTGNYNAQNIVLSSTGATSVNITTAASGNAVSPKALTITANNRTKTYGTTLTLGTSEFTSNGLANSETIGSVTLSAAGAASTATTAVGAYPITPSAATGGTFTASNYAITYVDGTLTINKADQTITFGSLSAKTYGDAVFDLAGTSSSGLALTYSSSNTDVATVSGNTVTIVGAGSTTITASQAGDDNHNAATSVDQVLTINKKSLTITGLSAESKTFDGTTAATLTGTPVLNGVVGSDDVSLTGTPTATFASSSVGQNITVNVTGYSLTGANAGDYEIQPLSLSADIIATTPTLFVNETLSVLTTTYGTPSTTTSFTVSGQSLTEEITITAPSGFEVSSTSSTTGFANEISIPHVSGSVATTTIYVRLSSAAKPVNSPFSGDIVIKSTGATTLTVATSTSTVSKKELTVTGLTGEDKTYDGTTTATVLGTASLVGLINSDDVSVDGTHVFTFADANAGTDKPITASGFTLNGLDKDNYTLAQPTSLTATITKANQTVVAIESTVTKTYGDATYSIATIASSGLAVTYTSSNTAVATVAADGTVTIVGAGSTTLTASQSGNGNYNAAPSVTQELTVDKANQTITAITSTMTKSYGDSPYSIATTASSGLAVTYSSSNTAVATVAANGTVTIVGVGTATLTASQSGNGNYNAATSVTQELTVGKGNQTITLAATATKTTTDAPYTLTQNASSGLAITYTSSNPAVATISGNTVTIVGVGTTTITANQAGNENYNAAPEATQTLTVTQGVSPIVGWDMSTQTGGTNNFGTSPLAPNTSVTNATNGSLIRGSGVVTSGSAASRAWGGLGWNYTTADLAIAANRFITFTTKPNSGYSMSLSSLNPFGYRASGTGAASVALQYQINSGTFTTITTFTNLSTSTSGGTFSSVDLSVIPELQNIPSSSTVTFRIVPFGASSSTGTFYIYDTANTTANDLVLNGFVQQLQAPVITSSLTASGKVGAAFNYNVTASNIPSSYSATGLPTGLSINSNSGLISGTPTEAGNFDVTIGATNTTGTGTKTLVLSIAKGDQTITFTSLASKTYGDAAFDLAGTSSSGLALTYSSSNTDVATVSGSTVTIVGTGSTTITASQSGDGNHNAATSVDQVLTINKKSLTITGLSAESKIFDGTTAATLTGTPVLNGVVGSDDVSLTGTPTATFASSSVGHAIAVTVSGYSLTGAKAGDYQLVEPTLSADIIATTPTLFANGTLSALTTTYGTASSSTSFNVSGQSLTDVITITAPSGFEVSSGGAYASSITVGGTETVSSVSIDVRLSSTAKPVNSPYSGDIVISSPGATSINVATVSSTVSKKELTVTGLTGVDKTYDGTTTATVSGTAALSGIVNSDDVSISGTHEFTFADANAGTSKPITASGFTLSGTDADNYTLTQPTGLTATISKADQTVVAIESTVTKTYGDATYSIATTASSGLAVTYTSSNTAVATVAANGTVTIVGGGTATLTASQSGNGNYNAAPSVTQALTVDKANQTITAITATMTKSYGDATYSIATTASSGLAVTYASSNTAVATVAANGTVTIVGVGSTTLTASQSGNGNYNAATSVTQELTVGKGNQTITLAATATKTTTDAPYTLTQNASSGLAITYTSSNPAVATISGNTVTIVGVGTTTITANQAGNENYNAAPEVTQTLTITQGSLALAKYIFNGTACDPSTRAASNVAPNLTFSLASVTGPSCNSNSSTAYSVGGSSWGTSFNSSRYVEFTVTPNAGYLVSATSLTFDILRTSAGATNATVRSSVDNYASDLITPFSVGTTSANKSITLDGVSFTNKSSAITFRIYGWGGNSTGDLRLDNITLNGYTTQIPPVITSSLTASGKVGTSLSYNVTASNTPSSYSATGLPTGLSINSNSGLISGTPTEAGNFDVTIGATNAAGTDAKTLVINIAKGDQTITFASLTDKLDTVGTFTLSATASSGLNVTYTSSNTSVLTIAGNVATVLAPGITTITASQAGDDNYNAATDVSQEQKIVDSTITVWDGTAWSNGEPTSSLKAILDGDYDGSSFESQTLTVNTGKTLTVNSFVKTGNVTNNGNIIVANNANFLQIGSFTSGDGASFKVRKDTKAVKRLAYMNWSSPMANSSQTLKQFSYGKNANGTAQSSTGTLDNRFYTYNNNAYVLTAPSGTFTKGQGYLIRTPNDFTTTPQIFHAQFEGTIPNAGTITYDHSSLQGNFILLGNPYPSAISYDDFISQNTNTTGTVYVWNSQVEMVNNQYAGTIYNTFTSAGANPANSLDAYIPVGQGFFVQRTNNDPFVFTDTMRRTTEVGVTSKSSTVSKNRFWLELTSPSGAKPQMLLGFFSATTKGIDKGYDAILLDATTETLYSTVEDKKLIIDAHGGFDEADEFSLSANLTAGGNYTISLLQKEGIFSNGQKIYLKDNLTGSVTDLTTDKYEFTETAGLKSNRFTLQFKSSGVLGSQDLAKEELNIISVGKEVRIKAGQNVATVEIYDLTGKKLIKVQPNQRETVINLSAEGMIVVKVTLQNGREKSKKLIIK